MVIGNDGEDLYFGLVEEPFFKELFEKAEDNATDFDFCGYSANCVAHF